MRIMATTARIYQFVNAPAAPRSERIVSELWERHRAEATRIYLEASVEEVVVQMRLRHNFQASTRQYVYQFKKWGVKKQGPQLQVGGAASVPSSQITALPSVPTAPTRRPLKRRRSSIVNDTGSVSGTESPLIKPLVKKRERQDGTPNPNEPHHAGETSNCDAKILAEPANISMKGAPGSLKHTNEPHASMPSPNASTSFRDQPRTPPPSPVGPRMIDLAQPMETFSGQDIANVKRAADFLAMLHCDQEAFELYNMLFEHRRSHPAMHADTTSWYLILQCASTASNPEHSTTIRNIIEAESGGPSSLESSSSMHEFLSHMLLAFVCNRNSELQRVEVNLANARALAPHDLIGLFKHVSQHDRSLDLALYLNALRLRAGDLSSLPFANSHGTAREQQRYMARLEDHVLRNVPGPIGFQEHIGLNNPCLRSCLVWCKERLFTLCLPPHKQGGWKVHSVYGENTAPWSERDSLFVQLWQQWGPNKDCDMPTWVHNTQSATGISPTEMLMVVCRMIYDCYDGWADPVDSNDLLMQRFSQGAARILDKSDLELGRGFLKQYVARNAITLWPDLLKDTRSQDRLCIIECLERTLNVKLLNLSTDLSSPLPPIRSFSGPGMGDNAWPTLARSLSSLDLSNFKKTRVSAARRLSRFGTSPGSVLSFQSLDASENKQVSVAEQTDLNVSLKSMQISRETSEKTQVPSWANVIVAFSIDAAS
ncbi:hypothetical protein B0T16DRAFT_491093 [Cercophora newfieldiana]|uniref:Clr5 domain-containing protein n=1 Tax=Cercophora newfieldiana TaxID=92897 RepID=A0AA39Y967_9PEZI|nr:hypothetical protein B0T16DRAFT_491093 [Cercophora newfieldiana]